MTIEPTGIDHLCIAVSDMARVETFYDRVPVAAFGFRKNRSDLGGEPDVQFYGRRFGHVLRPAGAAGAHDPHAPGLHRLCLQVDSIADMRAAAAALRTAGVDAGGPTHYPGHAADHRATDFGDPDGLRLEVTNFRQERREWHDQWDALEDHRS